MDDSVINLINEAAGIKELVPALVYSSIIGQIRTGNLEGAAKGIERIKRRKAYNMTKHESSAWNAELLTRIKSEVMECIDYEKTNESAYSKEKRKLRAFEEIVDILGMRGGNEEC